MIRVLHVITTTSIGGAEMMLYNLITNMKPASFFSEVLSIKSRDAVAAYLDAGGTPTCSMDLNHAFSLPRALLKLHKIVLKKKPDIIQGWMYHGNVVASIMHYLQKTSIPVAWNIRHSIYDIHSEKKLTRYMISLGARLSYRVNKIIFNSKISAKQHEELGYSSDKTIVIPNGFDTYRFHPDSAAKIALRSELNMAENTKLVGLIARYHPLKDHATFLRAAKIVNNHEPHIKFILAGRGADRGNYKLRQLIDKLDISKAIFLLGERKDIPKLSAALDIACSSSQSEAFPNAIGEAMACGVPCVATNVGEAASLIGDTGRIVPPGNPEHLSKAILELIKISENERRILGSSARKKIEQHYSLDVITKKYESFYRQLLQ